MNEAASKALELMSQMCGVVGQTAEYMWPLWVKMVMWDWIGGVVCFFIASVALGVVLWKAITRITTTEYKDYATEPIFLGFVIGISGVGLLICATVFISELGGISHIMVPEAVALRELLEAAK